MDGNKCYYVVAVIFVILIVIGLGVWYYYFKRAPKEGFWNIPSRTWKVERVFGPPCDSMTDADGPDFFQTPNFQGILSPRFSNVDYGPYLRTQLPSYDMVGVPADPLGGKVGGSFDAAQSGCIQQNPPMLVAANGCGDVTNARLGSFLATEPQYQLQRVAIDPTFPSAAYANGNYKNVLAQGMSPQLVSGCEESLSVPMMSSNGELMQPQIYDRYIYANRSSRLRGAGDPIRGDLPIVPISGNWFTPSVHPNIDLQEGAINVMAGVSNETNNQLANLIYHSSGGGNTTIGGVDLASCNSGGNQMFGASAAARGDVIMTSFP